MSHNRRPRPAMPDRRLLSPPVVRDDFWNHEAIREACQQRHMGQLVRAYRHHPTHGSRPLSQEWVASWFNLSQTQLSKIESHSPITDLSRLYEFARVLHMPERILWFTLPERDGAGRPAPVSPGGVDRRAVLLGVSSLPILVSESVRGLREKLNESLGATSVADATVAHWSAIADEYGRAYRAAAPVPFLVTLAQDLGELRTLTDRRLPTAQRRALCHSTARMTGLLATTLVNLNEYREARNWFHTAHLAAQESEDIPIQGWVLVRHAVSALYWGDPAGALKRSHEALQLTQQVPCVATAWAPAVQARALALHGAMDLVRQRLELAQASFERLESLAHEQDAYGYTSAQLHFYRSNALSGIGETAEAYEAQTLALAAYPVGAYLDPALVRLDQARCHLHDGETEEAASLTNRILIELPSDHRSPIVLQGVQQFHRAIPGRQQSLAAVQELQATMVAIGPGTS
jgi:tetratricopeptide (TPR) repeat protein